jgi:hypothetical protein
LHVGHWCKLGVSHRVQCRVNTACSSTSRAASGLGPSLVYTRAHPRRDGRVDVHRTHRDNVHSHGSPRAGRAWRAGGGPRTLPLLCRAPQPGRERGVDEGVKQRGARAVRRRSRSRNAIVPAADPERPIAESETHRSLPDYSGPHTYLLHCWYVIGVYRKVTRTRGKSSLLLYSTCSCEQNHLFSWSATNCLLGLSSLSAHPSMTSDEAPSPRQGDS